MNHSLGTLDVHPQHCPYCGERIELLIDPDAAGQQYIEDCEVYCRPMVIIVEIGDSGVLSIQVHDENSC